MDVTRKRIVICSVYPPTAYGIAAVARRHARGLHALDWDIQVVTTTCVPPEYCEADPFPIHRNPTSGQIRHICQQSQAVIIEGDALVYLMPVKASRTPYLVVHHGQRPGCLFARPEVDPSSMHPIWRFCRYFLVRHYLRKAAANISVSQRTADLLGLPNSTVIPVPVDPNEFPQAANDCATNGGSRRIGFLGRFHREKRPDLAIQVLARLRDPAVTLHMYGDGDLRLQLEHLSRALGLQDRVIFHGFVQGESLNAAIRGLRCILAPSQWEEPFCTVAAESLYCGTPVIGSDRGGLPVTIGPGGFIRSVHDVDGWVQDTELLLSTADLHHRLAAAGRRYVVDNFLSEVVAQRFDKLLQSLLVGARGRALIAAVPPIIH